MASSQWRQGQSWGRDTYAHASCTEESCGQTAKWRPYRDWQQSSWRQEDHWQASAHECHRDTQASFYSGRCWRGRSHYDDAAQDVEESLQVIETPKQAAEPRRKSLPPPQAMDIESTKLQHCRSSERFCLQENMHKKNSQRSYASKVVSEDAPTYIAPRPSGRVWRKPAQTIASVSTPARGTTHCKEQKLRGTHHGVRNICADNAVSNRSVPANAGQCSSNSVDIERVSSSASVTPPSIKPGVSINTEVADRTDSQDNSGTSADRVIMDKLLDSFKLMLEMQSTALARAGDEHVASSRPLRRAESQRTRRLSEPSRPVSVARKHRRSLGTRRRRSCSSLPSGHEVETGESSARVDPALAGVIDLLAPPNEPTPSAPPDGGCWEWPLSRHERKMRVALVDQKLLRLDRQLIVAKLQDLQAGKITD